MAAVVGNMAGATGAAEWADWGLISDTKLLWCLLGFAHGRQERRDFLLISCLIRLIHLLSLYKEVYLTPKQATN